MKLTRLKSEPFLNIHRCDTTKKKKKKNPRWNASSRHDSDDAVGSKFLDQQRRFDAVKIARAMSAGPTEVAKAARIVDSDAQGKTVVLREGNNGFTCMPGNLKVVGEPPCVSMPQCSGTMTPKLTNRNRQTRSRASLTCWPAPLSEAIPIPMTPRTCHRDRSPLDDHVALRSENYRTPNHAQANRSLHHVGRIALRAFAYHGTPIETIQHVGALNGHELWLKHIAS